ncbi:unnamed protein product [Protopolystoma xenopodis]|uniref:Uncharacterized protein n=1 Tax=Protopolystoma xenopodis TaxID=117903 RepID=A0A3S5BDE9_9PLAT|nr:unnamed protein product [Protopolystoma xenopodis]
MVPLVDRFHSVPVPVCVLPQALESCKLSPQRAERLGSDSHASRYQALRSRGRPDNQATKVVLAYSKRTSSTDNIFSWLPKVPAPHFPHRDLFSLG